MNQNENNINKWLWYAYWLRVSMMYTCWLIKNLYVRIFVLLIVMIVMRKLYFEIKTMSPPIKYLPYQRFISICICFSCFNVAFWFLLVFRSLVIHQYAYLCFQHFLVRVLFNSHNDVDGPLTTGKVYWRTCRTCYRFIRLLIIVLPVFVNSIVIK